MDYKDVDEISNYVIDRNSVFYIGLGKTGSSSIFHGLKNSTTSVCHYHSHIYFNYVTGAKMKSDQELIDFISNIGYMLGFRPKVIECLREPRSRAISALWHNWFNDGYTIKELLQKPVDELELLLEPYLDENPFHQSVRVPDNIDFIVLHLEERDRWQNILKSHGIDWEYLDTNVTTHPEYTELKKKLERTV